MMKRRALVAGAMAFGLAAPWIATRGRADDVSGSVRPFLPPEAWAAKLVAAAEAQVGETTVYDGSYRRLAYPMGDVPREIGVCTDVVVRAYRDAFGVDLQRLVHEDMRRNFAAYPRNWGLKRPDRNIDHRRVPNLERFFARAGAALPVTRDPRDYEPGDLVSSRLPGNLPHIVVVSARANRDRSRPLVVHNIGRGTQVEDALFAFDIRGHYRFTPPS